MASYQRSNKSSIFQTGFHGRPVAHEVLPCFIGKELLGSDEFQKNDLNYVKGVIFSVYSALPFKVNAWQN